MTASADYWADDDAPFGAALPPLSALATDLKAEAITIRVRWFGVLVGLAIVNGPVVFGAASPLAAKLVTLNGVLLFGAVFAAVDTLWSRRGQVFLGDVPLFVSAMEAAFIGLLCYFERGFDSPFRVYYFLSLLIAAIRYRPRVTWLTLAMHAGSYLMVLLASGDPAWSVGGLTLVLMAWVTWACESLSRLLRTRAAAIRAANDELRENQSLLEDRIARRTAELQQSQGLLIQQEKQAAFGLLAAGIAHEVGNPLAAISSLIQLLRRRTHDDYTSGRLDTIDTQLQRIQRTLREMTSYSRPASRERMRIDIREACEAALSIAKYYKRRKGKQIRTDYADMPPVLTTHDQLVQVVLNLVLNAMDATHEGGVIEVSTRQETGVGDDAAAVLRVRDDGPGVPAETRDRLFQPYVTSKSDGTGLGLFVCRNIVGQLGGELTLERSDGHGTTFAVRLPMRPKDAEETGNTATFSSELARVSRRSGQDR